MGIMGKFLDDASKNKIMVIGDIMLDQYVTGKAKRLCPEAPVPVLVPEETGSCLGGAANTAVNIRNIGGQVFLAGVVGKDDEGDIVRKMLKSKDITLVLGVDAARPTTVKKRIGTRQQLIVRLDREICNDISSGMFHDILKVVTMLSDDLSLVIIADYGKGVVTGELMTAIIGICGQKGIPVLVDPKGNNFKKYAGADIIKPNFSALENIYGEEIKDLESLEKAVALVFDTTGCKACIVTWDSNGAILFESPGMWKHFPCAGRTNQSYMAGAGDVFIAGLSMGITMGLPLDISCDVANQLASSAPGGAITLTVSSDDWNRLIAGCGKGV